MKKINIAEARANFSRYIKSVERGETIIVCRRNVPVAEIRALPSPLQEECPVGIGRGMAIPANFHDPLPDCMLDEFEGVTEARAMRGSGWQGDLEEMRRDRIRSITESSGRE